MLKLLSNLNILQRMEISISNWTTAESDGLKQGMWIGVDGRPPSGSEGAWPIWTESNRDNTYGFTPDAVATGKLTVLVGTHRAVTDCVTASGISAGSPLKVDTNGYLALGTFGTDHIFAFAEEDVAALTYMGTTYANTVQYITA